MKKIFLCAIFCFGVSLIHAQTKVDYLIKNAYVFDGTGIDSVLIDVGVSGDRIVFVGNSKNTKIIAKKEIDASGKYLSPGFIDPHTHIERLFNSSKSEDRAALIWLRQGVTTVLTGNDGYGLTNTGDIFSKWESNGIGLNVGMYIGFGPVRTEVLGSKPAQPNPQQIIEMQGIVDKAMQEGAIGFSTGLSYLPQTFSKTPEIVALSKAAAKYDGIYDTHMRAQSWPSSKEAIEEVLTIEKEAGIRVHISHIKSSGISAFGKSINIIKLLQDARKKGSSITASVYPYTASANGLRGKLPLWSRENGNSEMLANFDNPEKLEKIKAALRDNLKRAGGGRNEMISTRSKSMANLNGKTIEEISKEWNVSEEETIIKILRRNPTIGVISFGMREDDIENFIKQPYICVGSDGSDSHPRGAGTFAKVIGEFVLQKKMMPLKEMIHKSTGLTAQIFKLKDRGVIKEGAYADIVVFDPKTYKANSNYEEPANLATGVQAVFVNGQLVIANDNFNGKLVGKPIRYNKQ